MGIKELAPIYLSLNKEKDSIEFELTRKIREINKKKEQLIADYVAEHRKFKNGDIVCLADSTSQNPKKYRITDACGVEYIQEDNPYIDIRYGTESLNGGKGCYGGWSVPERNIILAK